MRPLDRCLACGATERRALGLEYRYQGGHFPLVECRACRMRFLAVQPGPEQLAAWYDATYFESEFRCGRTTAPSSDESAFRDENRGLLDAFAALGAPARERGATGRLLDVGCASGWLVHHANQRGWQAQGVELSPDAAARARAMGLDVFQGDLLGARLPAGHFDLVYMGDVLEHVPDCRAVVDEVARILRPGGLFYLRGPITTNSIARTLALAIYGALGRPLVLNEVPYHLWEFTPRSLTTLMTTAGLVVTSMRQAKIPPGHNRGQKSALQRAAMLTLDFLNQPITQFFNAKGDRVVMVARRPG